MQKCSWRKKVNWLTGHASPQKEIRLANGWSNGGFYYEMTLVIKSGH